MIPLSAFLIVWLLLLLVYLLFSFVSVVQMLRYSVAGSTAYVSTGIFAAVAIIIILSTGIYLLGVDWSLSLDLSRVFAVPGPAF